MCLAYAVVTGRGAWGIRSSDSRYVAWKYID